MHTVITAILLLSVRALAFLEPSKMRRYDYLTPSGPVDHHPCIEHHNVRAADGTRLTTLLVIPYPCDEPHPAVLDRTPYGPTLDFISALFVPSGFTLIAQNQRGCFTSGGDYSFWKQDGSDAYDTMVWFANHSTYNGEIFLSGASADGCSALADFAFTEPSTGLANPYIKGASYIWATALGHEAAYWGGAFRADLISHWLLSLDTCPNSVNIEQEVRDNEAYTEWWAPLEGNGPYGNNFVNVHVPSISQAGWHDIFLQGQLDSFAGTLEFVDPATAEHMWLWVIPGGHCTGDEADFGYPQFESLESFPRMAEQIFKGNFADPIFAVTERYNVYVMGPVPFYTSEAEKAAGVVGNYWTSFPDWPAANPTNWYLGAGGVVSPEPPTEPAAFTYTYDPSAPAPAMGANTLYSSTPCGPRDQTPLFGRPDVLVFTAAAAFDSPVAVVGRVTATLAVASTAVDTDFYVTLTDTYPDGGPVVNVRYGAAKMRWNTPAATPQAAANMVPGEVYTVTLDLWTTAYVFNPGHRLGVVVASARHPEFAVNPNNGLPLADQADGPTLVANNTVYADPFGAGLSYLTLPVVDIADIAVNPHIR